VGVTPYLKSVLDIGVARIFSGAHFFLEKVDDLFLVVALKLVQDAQLSQRDRAAGCVIVFAKSRTLERGDNDLRIL